MMSCDICHDTTGPFEIEEYKDKVVLMCEKCAKKIRKQKKQKTREWDYYEYSMRR